MILNKNYVSCEIFRRKYKNQKNIVIIGLKWNGQNVRRRTNGFAKDFIRKRRNTKCLYCNILLIDDNVTADHVIPISQGGSNCQVNLIVCCETCNFERGNMDFMEYLKSKNPTYKKSKYVFI